MNKLSIFCCGLLFFQIVACQKAYTPKKRAYFRIDFPDKKYRLIENIYPYSFEIPKYAVIEKDNSTQSKAYWINIKFPSFKGIIHMSYYPIHENLDDFTEDAHELAFKHTVKADAIRRKEFTNTLKRVFATLYDIEGNVASNVQFAATDSLHHFLRGSLYFNIRPKKDSIQPVVQFLRADIIHLLETLEWKN